MAKVTYRGVPYDTKNVKSCTKDETVLTYRGTTFVKKIQNCVAS